MPALVLIAAPAGAQPRLRAETLSAYEKKGYVLDRRLETAAWPELFEEALTPSLFVPRRIFEVDDGRSLGVLPDKYKKYVERGDVDVIFLIHSDKSLQKELGDVFETAFSVPYETAPYWPSQRVGWLQRIARASGCTLDAAAAALLAEWIEDEEELRSEVDKLAKAAPNKRITVQQVNSLSMDEGGKGVLNLLDAVAKADVAAAVKSLAVLREEGELIPALAAVHKRVRGAMFAARLGDAGAGAVHLTNFQTKTARAMAQTYGPELLSLWLGELIRLSWSERSGEGEGWEGLEKLLLAVMSRAAG